MAGHQENEKDAALAAVEPASEYDQAGSDQYEVFKKDVDGVDYRTNGIYKTFFLMFKIQFSLGILSIPSVFGPVGAVPGSLIIIGWGLWNGWAAFIQAGFRNRHGGVHGVQDMAMIVGGKAYKELVGGLYLLGFVLVTGSGYIAGSVAFNALSEHGACTVWFAFVSFIFCTVTAAFPKFSQISILCWLGVFSIYIAVLILTIAVGVQDRPAAAPQTGDFDPDFVAVGSPTFLTGLAASTVIFISSSGHSAFVPIIAEMRNPRDYKKPVAACMSFLSISYLVISLVIYRYCGQYIASPSLGSAGPLIKKICYGVGLPGILISTTINQHLASKYLFVRLLRDTKHLQQKTMIHWATWLGSVVGVGILAFVVAEAIPGFNSLLGLVSSISFTPLAVIFPATFWLYDFGSYRKGNLKRKAAWAIHVLFIFIGLFQMVAGAYAAIQSIIDLYAADQAGTAFSCLDNAST